MKVNHLQAILRIQKDSGSDYSKIRGKHNLSLWLREAIIFVKFHLCEHFDDSNLAFVQKSHSFSVYLSVINNLITVTVTRIDDGKVALDSHLFHNDWFLYVFSGYLVKIRFYNKVGDTVIEKVIFHLFNDCIKISTRVKERP